MTGRFEFGHGRNELHNRLGHISNYLLLYWFPHTWMRSLHGHPR